MYISLYGENHKGPASAAASEVVAFVDVASAVASADCASADAACAVDSASAADAASAVALTASAAASAAFAAAAFAKTWQPGNRKMRTIPVLHSFRQVRSSKFLEQIFGLAAHAGPCKGRKTHRRTVHAVLLSNRLGFVWG